MAYHASAMEVSVTFWRLFPISVASYISPQHRSSFLKQKLDNSPGPSNNSALAICILFFCLLKIRQYHQYRKGFLCWAYWNSATLFGHFEMLTVIRSPRKRKVRVPNYRANSNVIIQLAQSSNKTLCLNLQPICCLQKESMFKTFYSFLKEAEALICSQSFTNGNQSLEGW